MLVIQTIRLKFYIHIFIFDIFVFIHRPENESERKPCKCVIRVAIMLGIPLVIVTTVTLLCIPSYLQQAITDILVPEDSSQGAADVLLTTTVYNRGKLFAVTIPHPTATTMTEVAKNEADNLPAIDSGPTTSGGDSAVRPPPTPVHATSRSLNNDITILPQDDKFVIKPSAPLRLVIGDNMTYVNPPSIDRDGENNMTVDEADIRTGINQTNERCENSVFFFFFLFAFTP